MFLPRGCYGYSRPPLVQNGIVAHYMSALYANTIGLDNVDPFSVSVCYDILKHYKYSAHVIIDRDGNQFQLVPFECQAYHAGLSLMNGKEDCNKFTLSFECLSIGKPNINGDPAYTDVQIDSVIALIQLWVNRYYISRNWIQGHDDVRNAAIKAGITYKTGAKKGQLPGVKHDPGPHFPWPHILDNIIFN
jgi:N-acetyl-anhydromuramyl-L-alanine amidase AmpD